jgi:hypothetical protein
MADRPSLIRSGRSLFFIAPPIGVKVWFVRIEAMGLAGFLRCVRAVVVIFLALIGGISTAIRMRRLMDARTMTARLERL